ncbi:MAG: amidohydrolase, partial [Cyanobacteria bacterium]|nr:amidohydrolase [Cyanobacteriota bacterium]
MSHPVADWVIANATLAGKPGPWHLALQGDLITAVSPDPITAPTIWDAQGQLVIPGLVDAHIHLDKALLLPQAPATTGTFAEAMAETLRLKHHY